MATGRFGRLWAKGHETFSPTARRILHVRGKGATSYLQGLVTCDLLSPPPTPRQEEIPEEEEEDAHASHGHGSPKLISPDDNDTTTTPVGDVLRAACFLNVKGRILTDALLWNRGQDNAVNKGEEESYYIDVASDAADDLLDHLKTYKVGRSTRKVKVTEETDVVTPHVVYGTRNNAGSPPGFMAAVDPRHPSLGLRLLSLGTTTTTTTTNDSPSPLSFHERKTQFESLLNQQTFPPATGTYDVLRRLCGIAEGTTELQNRTPLECNQELLGAVSFSKGCYLGQELTARTMYKGVVRKRIVPLLFFGTRTQIPLPWMALGSSSSSSSGRKDGEKMEKDGEEVEKQDEEGGEKGVPPLPRLSGAAAAGFMAMLQGDLRPQTDNDQKKSNQNNQAESKEEHKEPNAANLKDANHHTREDEDPTNNELEVDRVLAELKQYATMGAKIVDKTNGRTIGEIVSPPVNNTTIVLAQMRLDRIGLQRSSSSKQLKTTTTTTLAKPGKPGQQQQQQEPSSSSSLRESWEDGSKVKDSSSTALLSSEWRPTNKVIVGDGKTELRYLPYLPLWWPPMDEETGKQRST